MFLEYDSFLIAAGTTAAVICLTFFLSWLSDRTINFLVTAGSAMLTITIAIICFATYITSKSAVFGFSAAISLTFGLALGQAAARQYRTGKLSPRLVTILSLTMLPPMILAQILGFDGLVFIQLNFYCAILLVTMAREYWYCRRESPAVTILLCALYVILSVSFLICAIMLAIETPLVLNGPPTNWAESLNVMVSVLAVAGIGALSIALHHQRLIKRHRNAAMTDALTGLLNRRALFEAYGEELLPPGTAIVLFDLDHFKQVNDRHGHTAGDNVLIRFAEICSAYIGINDTAIRMGGEEFLIVMPYTSGDKALVIAERIRIALAKEVFTTDEGVLRCTVSAGIYAAHPLEHLPLDTSLRHADKALYVAKDTGRNRTRLQEPRLVA